jgi:uncharacterized membrane protein YccC
MDRQKLYVETLGVVFSVMTIWLSAYNEQRLEVYLSLFAVGYFAITTLFRPKKRLFDVVGAGLFLVFCYIVAMKVLDILSTI